MSQQDEVPPASPTVGRLQSPVRWQLPAARYAAVFAAAPVALLLLDPDLVIIDANEAYLRSTGLAGEAGRTVFGRYVFDVFPNDPAQVGVAGADQVSTLRELMQRALDTGHRQVLTGLRYDIPVPGTGRFELRHWNVTEVPLLDEHGAVVLLLHFSEDITDLVAQLQAGQAVADANAALQAQIGRAQADLLQRAQDLQELNERLHRSGTHDRTVAAALQQALLTALPEPDHLQLVARYRTAAAEDQVGGDWYDAVVLPAGATALVIGDVLGHDINAAALMGQLRSLLRALAWRHEQHPAAVLEQLDQAMRDLQVATLATVILAKIEQDPTDAARGLRRVRWSNAGHPPPILVDPDGSSTVLDGDHADVLLGVAPHTARHDHTHTVAAGSCLLLYTDGLIETRTRDLDDGLHRLRHALRTHAGLPADALIDAVLTDMVGEHPADDVAVLLVRFQR